MNLRPLFFPVLAASTFCVFLSSCATYGLQQGKITVPAEQRQKDPNLKVVILGDVANPNETELANALQSAKKTLDSASDKSVLILTGDNTLPKGQSLRESYNNLYKKLQLPPNFNGKILVIPSKHRWYAVENSSADHDLFSDKKQQKLIQFLPSKGCPIEQVDLDEKTIAIAIDSEWYITNWDKQYGINKNCKINNRKHFLSELDELFLLNQNKTILLLMHHPVLNSGVHAGFDSFKTHLFPFNSKIPLPVAGTVIRAAQKASGVSPADIQNDHYGQLADRIRNMFQNNKNIIVISGHEHNLQYLEQRNIRQIISGASAKSDPATVKNKTDFSYGGTGYAVLNLYEKGKSDVEFYSAQEKQLAKLKVTGENRTDSGEFQENRWQETYTGTLYTDNLVKRSKFYTFLMGKKFRDYYGTPFTVPTADLSKLKGGLKPLGEGGEFQYSSLRMSNSKGQIFSMRQISKNANLVLQKLPGFNRNTFGDAFEDTYAKSVVQDFFTSNHPFTPLIIGKMADKIDVFHTNPEIYFVAKQKTLGKYNEVYGDQVYLIEEQISDDPATRAYFDDAKKFEKTYDVIENLKEPQQFSVDESSYIRARLFDMIIGDSERQEDKWSWAAYDSNGKTVYKPIPVERAQTFPKYEGILLKLIMTSPSLRHMKNYRKEIKNIKWTNKTAYPLDLIFAKSSNADDWKKQAEFIQKNLKPTDVSAAFAALPREFKDENAKILEQKLNARVQNLQETAERYYLALQKKPIVTGTDKNDHFVLQKDANSIKISAYNMDSSGKKVLFFHKQYFQNETDEIWIYGLNGEDHFEVLGSQNPKIRVRMIGGYDADEFTGEQGNKTKIYDFSEEENTLNLRGASARISKDYNLNTYHSQNATHSFHTIMPMLGYNPDDGIKLMANAAYTVNNFIREPFSQKHKLQLGISTHTGAFTAKYSGIFKKAVGNMDFGLDANYFSPNYVQNFFGLSNESSYNRDLFKDHYNRVRMSQIRFAPSLSNKSYRGFTNKFEAEYENVKLQDTPERIVENSADVSAYLYRPTAYTGLSYSFGYANAVKPYFPDFGLSFFVKTGWKTALQNSKKSFLTVAGNLDFVHRIDPNARFVLANSTDYKWINNTNFEFFQAANIGGDNSLRSYRRERFSGKSALANSTDVRWNFGQVKNGIVPANMGVFVGYDIGRVWNQHETSDKWHQSYGGGFWIGILETFSGKIQYFTGDDGGRISAGLGFGF